MNEKLQQIATPPTDGNNSNSTQKKESLYLQTAMHAAGIALGNGAETARCEEIMGYILSQSGEKNYSTSIVSTSIFARLGEKTGLLTIKKWNTNLNKVHLTNEVSRKLCNNQITIEEASEQLNVIEKQTIYGFPMRLFAYIILTAALPILISGTIYDCILGAFCGIIMACMDTFFRRIPIRSFVVTLVQTLIIVLITFAASIISHELININVVVISAITPMLPGLALTNSVRDTLQGDYVSGGGRMVEAMVRAMALVLGVATGLTLGTFFPGGQGIEGSSLEGALASGDALLPVCIIAALVSAFGFCIVMEIPPKFLIPATLTGAIGKLLFMMFYWMGISSELGTFVSTAVITIMSQLFAKRMKTPTILFLISGIMSLVPGSSLYFSVFDFIGEIPLDGVSSLVDTMITGASIAVAIFLVDTVFNLIASAKKRKGASA